MFPVAPTPGAPPRTSSAPWPKPRAPGPAELPPRPVRRALLAVFLPRSQSPELSACRRNPSAPHRGSVLGRGAGFLYAPGGRAGLASHRPYPNRGDREAPRGHSDIAGFVRHCLRSPERASPGRRHPGEERTERTSPPGSPAALGRTARSLGRGSTQGPSAAPPLSPWHWSVGLRG